MSQDYQEFITSIKKKTGIDLAQYKEAQMKRRLMALYEKKGCRSFVEFYNLLDKNKDDFYEFLDRMTINVSEFYRNGSRWKVLEKQLLPQLFAKNKKLKVWSAACSTGEEPYTIAMVLSNFMPVSQISIMATDLDENVISRAKLGIYPERSLQEVPREMKDKYFRKEGTHYHVTDEIKRTVTFKKHNLLADNYESNFDLIVCRNVLIYFTEEAKAGIYKKFNAALRPSGILFVGSTEQIFNPQASNFEIADTFFYRKL